MSDTVYHLKSRIAFNINTKCDARTRCEDGPFTGMESASVVHPTQIGTTSQKRAAHGSAFTFASKHHQKAACTPDPVSRARMRSLSACTHPLVGVCVSATTSTSNRAIMRASVRLRDATAGASYLTKANCAKSGAIGSTLSG